MIRLWWFWYWFSGAVIPFTPAAVCRSYTVLSENRVSEIFAENRFEVVPAESRIAKPLCNTTEDK
jgi:hypothetical protein